METEMSAGQWLRERLFCTGVNEQDLTRRRLKLQTLAVGLVNTVKRKEGLGLFQDGLQHLCDCHHSHLPLLLHCLTFKPKYFSLLCSNYHSSYHS